MQVHSVTPVVFIALIYPDPSGRQMLLIPTLPSQMFHSFSPKRLAGVWAADLTQSYAPMEVFYLAQRLPFIGMGWIHFACCHICDFKSKIKRSTLQPTCVIATLIHVCANVQRCYQQGATISAEDLGNDMKSHLSSISFITL